MRQFIQATLVLCTSIPLLAASAAAEDEHGRDWGYRGEAGKIAPADWPGTCQERGTQSPINVALAAASGTPADPIGFFYRTGESVLRDNGHAIEVTRVAGYVEVTRARTPYELCGIHFHTPSEHTRENVGQPAEMHFVHKPRCEGAGPYLVVGWLIAEADDQHPSNPTLSGYLEGLGRLPFQTSELNPKNILTANDYAQYSGSLTTPGCDTGVTWFVSKQPLYLSERMLEGLRAYYPDNARPGQNLGERKIRGLR